MKSIKDLVSGNRSQKPSVNGEFKRFLRQNNCRWQEQQDKQDGTVRYYFDYQGGHFLADIRDNFGVDITFAGILDVPDDDLTLMRMLCNYHNSRSTIIKFTYNTNEEDNRVYVHLSAYVNTVWTDELPNIFNTFFFSQRLFCDEYYKLKPSADDSPGGDIEANHAESMRERFMLHQQELHHQPGDSADWHRGDSLKVSLSFLLEKMLGLKLLQFQRLVVDGKRQIDGHEPISQYELLRDCCLTDEDGHPTGPKQQPTTVTLTATIGTDDTPRIIQLLVTPEPSDVSDYVRVTATVVPESRSRRASISSTPQEPQTNSVILAINEPDIKQMLSEFDFMLKDAKIKLRDGEQLDDLQQHIVDITSPDMAYCLYWGRKFMLNERYVEALLYLENLFSVLRINIMNTSQRHRDAFYELCYCIGFCYNELRLYRDAFYYLDFLRSEGNIRYASELINALANGKDVRLFQITDQFMKAIREQYENDDDIPEGLQSFVNFMRRRRAYGLIDHNQLDEAEKAFTAMLDDPENSDYAINELAYIKRLRSSQAGDAAPLPDKDKQ